VPDPIRPQRGPQETALTSPADVVIFGGAAGGGKTFSLLLKPLQFVDIPTFSAVIFRRESPEITNPGSLWDESSRLYLDLGASPNRQLLEWRFPSGARVKFAHMQYEDDKLAWKSSQIPLVGFDQLESFTAGQFWYMLSRNRDPSGRVRSHVFGTCNPVPADDAVGGWLRELISWWIDPGTGLALEARAGAVRWLARAQDGDAVEWYDSAAAAADIPLFKGWTSADTAVERARAALAAFDGVLKDYPGARKSPDALLKAGYCQYELKRYAAARASLERVTGDFAGTQAAQDAAQRLGRMATEGH